MTLGPISANWNDIDRAGSAGFQPARGERSPPFVQSWTYNDLGRVAGLVYPRCTVGFAKCDTDTGGGGGWSHANGLVHEILHTNGIRVTQAADPSGMARPASITASFGAQTRWTTGTSSYDGSGNVVRIGTSWFLYDLVSRLTSATLYTDPTGGGTAKTLTYTLDTFGNSSCA